MKKSYYFNLTLKYSAWFVSIFLFASCNKNNLSQPVQPANAAALAAGAKYDVAATGTVSKTFPVQPFSKLVLTSEGNIEITQGDSETVSVEADNSRLTGLITVVNSGDTLLVKPTKGAGAAGPFKTFVVRITLKSVDYLQHRGGGVGDISTTNTLNLPAFTFDWFTTGKEKGYFSIKASSMKASMSGGLVNNFQDGVSTVYFYKSAISHVRLTRYGYGSFDGFYHSLGKPYGNANLDAQTLEVTNSGYGDAYVKASKKISLTNKGLGTIYYTGNATVVKKENTGGGTITKF